MCVFIRKAGRKIRGGVISRCLLFLFKQSVTALPGSMVMSYLDLVFSGLSRSWGCIGGALLQLPIVHRDVPGPSKMRINVMIYVNM